MNNIILLISGIIFGYLFFNLICSEKENGKNKVGLSFQIYIKDKECFHIHHWLILTLLLIYNLTIVKDIRFKYILYGFCFGGIIQGLKYKDRFIFCKQCIEQYYKK